MAMTSCRSLGHEGARVKPFDEVKAALTDDLKKQGLTDKMQEMADKIHAALLKSPGSADAIAKENSTPMWSTFRRPARVKRFPRWA